MAEVHQVLDNQHRVARDREGLAAPVPARMVHDAEIGNPALVGERRIARPEPDPVVFLDRRIAAHPRRRRDLRLARDVDAGAVGRKAQAVIGAFDRIAPDPAARKLGVAVAAAVLQRDRRAVACPVQHHRLAEEDPPHREEPFDLMVPGGDIPAVARKHPALTFPPAPSPSAIPRPFQQPRHPGQSNGEGRRIGAARAGDVVGAAMRDRAEQHRRADRDAERVAPAFQLDRDVALVVVHGDVGVEFAFLQQKIGAPRPGGGDAFGVRPGNRRRRDLGVFIAEKSAFAGMRVDAADRDPRLLDTEPAQGSIGRAQRAQHLLRRQAVEGLAQADMERRVDDSQARANQHKKHVVGVGPGRLGEQLRIAGERDAGLGNRGLVVRPGDDGVRFAGLGQPDGGAGIGDRRGARRRCHRARSQRARRRARQRLDRRDCNASLPPAVPTACLPGRAARRSPR